MLKQLSLIGCLLCCLNPVSALAACYGQLTKSPAQIVKGYFPKPFGVCTYPYSYYHSRRTLNLTLYTDANLVAQLVVTLPSGRQEGPGSQLAIRLSERGMYLIRVISRQGTYGGFKLQKGLR
jgi:hypothetical protein